jgi:hypothetical protein
MEQTHAINCAAAKIAARIHSVRMTGKKHGYESGTSAVTEGKTEDCQSNLIVFSKDSTPVAFSQRFHARCLGLVNRPMKFNQVSCFATDFCDASCPFTEEQPMTEKYDWSEQAAKTGDEWWDPDKSMSSMLKNASKSEQLSAMNALHKGPSGNAERFLPPSPLDHGSSNVAKDNANQTARPQKSGSSK